MRYIGIFSLVLAFSVAFANSNAQIAYADEDAQVGIVTNQVSEDQQDEVTPIDLELIQDGGKGINTNAVTEDTQDGTIGINTNSVTEDTQDGNQLATPSPTPNENGGHRNRSGGGSRRMASDLIVAPETFASANIIVSPVEAVAGDCTYLTEYLKFGGKNNPAEVRKLQLYLRDTEKLDVDVTDMFDEKTLAGVNAFQARYVKDTMGPWGASIPSGQVYISTLKKINELNCKNPIAFTANDLAIFDAYKKAKVEGTSVLSETEAPGSFFNGSDAGTSLDTNTNTDTSTDDEIGTTDENANAGSASVGFGAKIGNFFNGIFNFVFGK